MNKPDRDLFIYGLGMGDLVQLHSGKKETIDARDMSSKVIVGCGFDPEEADEWVMSHAWYFKYINSGTLAVYISRVPEGTYTLYWAQFHKVHCEGSICIVHEKYLFPEVWQFDPTNPPIYNYKPLYLSNIGGTGSI